MHPQNYEEQGYLLLKDGEVLSVVGDGGEPLPGRKPKNDDDYKEEPENQPIGSGRKLLLSIAAGLMIGLGAYLPIRLLQQRGQTLANPDAQQDLFIAEHPATRYSLDYVTVTEQEVLPYPGIDKEFQVTVRLDGQGAELTYRYYEQGNVGWAVPPDGGFGTALYNHALGYLQEHAGVDAYTKFNEGVAGQAQVVNEAIRYGFDLRDPEVRRAVQESAALFSPAQESGGVTR